ncbi:uncharacterized protein N7482_008758 [Penicillium canariense]|uniref:F-box domain-containing protein n=1 Tax=Penicillium canariense TaxID=189055 RepID=A0A9W9HTU3_9EURO|nr:uncharacterized protein N7482_008758 [Penicillium canariense]KAJ5157658.1 hypothetical protein N7482_008758 [Penicillium canariense]
MNWLEDVRILYRSIPYKTSINTSYKSGRFDVTGCLPHDEFTNEDPDSLGVFSPYEGDSFFSIPIHHACNGVLARFLDHAVGTNPTIYLEVLFKTLKSFHNAASRTCLGKMKYGKIANQQGQFWYPTVRTKEYVVDPFFPSSELIAYYEDLPQLRRDHATSGESKVDYTEARSGRGPFANLAPELLMMILMHLTVKTIGRLRVASADIAQLQLPNSFWKQKLMLDMPWLWDFPCLSAGQTLEGLDWLQIYKDLYLGSKPSNSRPFLTLVNRRRIWSICEQVAPRFDQFQREMEMMAQPAAYAKGL